MGEEQENLRAKNIIWTAAEDYTFRPQFLAQNGNEALDLYLNMVIGLVHKWYDTKKVEAYFDSLTGTSHQGACDALVWVALENAVYEQEKEKRPVLEELRSAYAGEILSRSAMLVKTLLEERINEAKCRLILGKKEVLAPDEEKLLKGLLASADADTDVLLSGINRALCAYYHTDVQKKKKWDGRIYLKHKLPALFKLHPPVQAVQRLNTDGNSDGDERGESTAEKLHELAAGLTGENEAKLKEKILDYFGEPLFDERIGKKLEKSLCVGNHADCHIYFSGGEGAYIRLKRHADPVEYERVQGQEEKNLSYYRAHERAFRTEIFRLRDRISNVLKMEQEAEWIPAAQGTLNAAKVWKAVHLNGRIVFDRRDKKEPEELLVTLLLDGSSSQLERQERIAAEAYMIAESLRLCYIPTQVYSFCSLSNYTVCQRLKDEDTDSHGIFRYTAIGFNRDGLALRAVGTQMPESRYRNRLLIVLTDASPNGGKLPGKKAYAGEDGKLDTAAEVRALKKQGIHVIGLFFGPDGNVKAARDIYGSGLARITDIERLAGTVGTLVQNEIQSIFR